MEIPELLFLMFSISCTYSSPDTIQVSFYKYGNKLNPVKPFKLCISYTDSFGNSITVKPRLDNGYILIDGFNFIKDSKVRFTYKGYDLTFDSSMLIFDRRVDWQFGIDTTLDEDLFKYPEFIERLPAKHSYYYLKMEPQYKGRGYTEYRFINYNKRKRRK